MTPDGMVGDGVVHSPEWGSLRTVASESSRQATTVVMKSPRRLMRLVTEEVEKKRTLLGPMCGPAWRPGSPNSPPGHE